MSEKILVLVAAGEGGALTRHDLETVALGGSLRAAAGGALEIGVFGGRAAAAAAALSALGAARVSVVSGEAYSVSRYKTDLAAALAIAGACGADLILMPALPRLNRIAAGLAQRLGGAFDAQVTAAAAAGGAVTVERWFYRQRMKGTVARTRRPWVLTVSPGACEAAQTAGEPAEVVELAVAAPATRTTVTGVRAAAGDAQTIRPEAAVLLVAGAGWTKKQADGALHVGEAAALILGFLDKADASLGSSKSLVDLGSEGHQVLPFLTHLHQIGQTGATPRHPKGLSTCCHGEEPHVVGWRFVPERRAISLDANCGWAHGKADVLYVADAFEVMRQVNALL